MPKTPVVKEDKTPKNLRPFVDHGVDFKSDDGAEAVGTCPFCGKEKFYVSVETGVWSCKVCQTGNRKGGGNHYTFIRELHAISKCLGPDAVKLASNRKLLLPSTLEKWGAVVSASTGEWLLPAWNHEHKLNQLYRYVKTSKKMMLYPTSEMGCGIFGLNQFDKNKSEVWIFETWNALAAQEVINGVKDDGADGWTPTANQALSIGADVNVVAIPGAGVFQESWVPLFQGKRVTIFFDSDHPKENNGRQVGCAGYNGTRRTAGMLSRPDGTGAESVHWLQWGPDGYDPDKASGWDVRDALTQAKDLRGRAAILRTLVKDKVKPIPPEWVGSGGGKAGSTQIEMDECKSWEEVREAWMSALRFTEGHEYALASMLATAVTTRVPGAQVWLQVISPPSCLHVDTPIHDPVDGSNLTVGERFDAGVPFNVYTRSEDGSLTVGTAEPPHRYPEAEMFEVIFKSGRTIKVTEGHRFWNGSSYVALRTIADELQSSSGVLLPSISDTDLSTRVRGVPHSLRTVPSSRSDCHPSSSSCGGPLHHESSSGRDASPSQVDARTRNHDGSGSDDLSHGGTHTRACPRSVLQSTGDDSLPVGQLQGVGESALSGSGGNDEQDHGMYRSAQHTELQSSHRGNRTSPVRRSVPSSTFGSGDSHHRELTGVCQSSPPSIRTSQPVSSATTRCCTRQESPVSERPRSESEQASEDPLLLADKSFVGDWITHVSPIGRFHYYDFHVPVTENYWAVGLFHHNTGKTTLSEGLGVNRKWTHSIDEFTGFYSGYTDGTDKDFSPIKKFIDKTLIIKEAANLLSADNRSKLLADLTASFDRKSGREWKNGKAVEDGGMNFTVVLQGTGTLRQLETAETGARFLTCAIMNSIDDDLEDDILERASFSAIRNMALETNCAIETHYEPDKLKAIKMTGGYLGWLRENANELCATASQNFPEKYRRLCCDYGRAISYMRARPSKVQDETADRELAARAVEQITKLAIGYAVVMNRPGVDAKCMKWVRQIMLDSTFGKSFDIVKRLRERGSEGMLMKDLVRSMNDDEKKQSPYRSFLCKIGVCEITETPVMQYSSRKIERIRLTDKMTRLWDSVMREQV